MSDLDRPNITVHIGTKGQVTGSLTEARLAGYTIDSQYLTSTDKFTIETYDVDPEALRRLELQPIEISIDGCQQLLGYIDSTKQGHHGTAVSITGRDYISRLVEDCVDPAMKVAAGMSVKAALLLAFAPQGIADVEGPIGRRNVMTGVTVGNPTPPKDFEAPKLDDYKPNPGENMYAYGNRIVARHGGTIQPSTRRDKIVLSVPDFGQDSVGRLVRRIGAGRASSNNLIEGHAERDWTNVPSVVVACGKAGRGKGGKKKTSAIDAEIKLSDYAPGALLDLAPAVRDAIAYDRPAPGAPAPAVEDKPYFYRLLFHRDEEARNAEQMDRIARRLMAERLRESLTYHAKVRGHKDPTTGAVYALDTVLDVDDEASGVRERMWVASRSLSWTRTTGAITDLELWRLNTLSL